jgi:hypothetical protein
VIRVESTPCNTARIAQRNEFEAFDARTPDADFALILIGAGLLFVKDIIAKSMSQVCQKCRKPIDKRATICPYCRSEVQA